MLSKLEIHLLTVLYEAYENLQAFSLFRRSNVSMADFTKAVRRLTEVSYITDQDNRLKLTESGKKLIVESLPLQRPGPKPWRTIPENFRGPKLASGEFYIPSKKRLDPKILGEHNI